MEKTDISQLKTEVHDLRTEVHTLRQEFRDRKNGNRWSVWIQIVVSALLTLFLAIALPWMKWVTSSITNLEAHDVKMEQWKENRATVLALNKEETLKEVREIISKEIGQLSGQIQTLQKQSVENGYDFRRLQEMLLQHLQDKQPKTSGPVRPMDYWRPGIVQTNLYGWTVVSNRWAMGIPRDAIHGVGLTNYYHIPGSSQQIGDDYALTH